MVNQISLSSVEAGEKPSIDSRYSADEVDVDVGNKCRVPQCGEEMSSATMSGKHVERVDVGKKCQVRQCREEMSTAMVESEVEYVSVDGNDVGVAYLSDNEDASVTAVLRILCSA